LLGIFLGGIHRDAEDGIDEVCFSHMEMPMESRAQHGHDLNK
jgi:hypothetical protein